MNKKTTRKNSRMLDEFVLDLYKGREMLIAERANLSPGIYQQLRQMYEAQIQKAVARKTVY